MSELPRLLNAFEPNYPPAAAQLLPLVYDDVRWLAASHLAHGAPGDTLDATALVHEAYRRLTRDKAGDRWEGRGHFFAAAAEAMCRILVENAHRKRSVKHGGGVRSVAFTPDGRHLATANANGTVYLLRPGMTP